ncbi:MAG: helix-turn-helix domain-containing protein [Alistipes sp.]
MKKESSEHLNFATLHVSGNNCIPFNYISFDNNEEPIILSDTPLLLHDGGLLLCLQGECEIIVNCKPQVVKRHDMFICFPSSIVQVVRKSEDFKGNLMAVNTAFTQKLNIPSVASFYLFIKDNPCIALSNRQTDSLLELLTLLQKKGGDTDHPYRTQQTTHLLMMICYEIAGIYHDFKPTTRKVYSRQDAILQQFLSLAVSDYMISRSVDYYADKLCVTPKYLSLVVQRSTGKSAATWIKDMVILNAKSLLKGTQMTILQISDKLNFANPSFFGQYFRRHTGCTPKAYRIE